MSSRTAWSPQLPPGQPTSQGYRVRVLKVQKAIYASPYLVSHPSSDLGSHCNESVLELSENVSILRYMFKKVKKMWILSIIYKILNFFKNLVLERISFRMCIMCPCPSIQRSTSSIFLQVQFTLFFETGSLSWPRACQLGYAGLPASPRYPPATIF